MPAVSRILLFDVLSNVDLCVSGGRARLPDETGHPSAPYLIVRSRWSLTTVSHDRTHPRHEHPQSPRVACLSKPASERPTLPRGARLADRPNAPSLCRARADRPEVPYRVRSVERLAASGTRASVPRDGRRRRASLTAPVACRASVRPMLLPDTRYVDSPHRITPPLGAPSLPNQPRDQQVSHATCQRRHRPDGPGENQLHPHGRSDRAGRPRAGRSRAPNASAGQQQCTMLCAGSETMTTTSASATAAWSTADTSGHANRRGWLSGVGRGPPAPQQRGAPATLGGRARRGGAW